MSSDKEELARLKELNKDNLQTIKKLKSEIKGACKKRVKSYLKRFKIIQKSLPIYKKYIKKQPLVSNINTNTNKTTNTKEPKEIKELLQNGYKYVEKKYNYTPDTPNINVVYALHNSLPETNNGYAIRSHYISKSVQSQNINIYPITRVGFPLDLNKIAKYENDNFNPVIDSLPYYRMNKDGFGWGKVTIPEYIENYSKMLAQFAYDRKATVIHAASNYINGLAAVNAAKILNIPSIYEVRGFWEITVASRNPDFKNTNLYKMQKQLDIQACTDASSVIALSEIVKEELMDRGIDKDKIYIIPNGVDTQKMKPLKRNIELLDTFKFKEKFIVGFIGSVVDYEGLELLIEASQKLLKDGYNNFRYLIVGDGNNLENLKKIVKEKNLSELFLFIGRVPYEDVERYYSIIDVACYPRLNWEICSIVSPKKPFEAMSYGIPVISSSVRANSYFIEDGVNGLVHKSEDSDSIVEKLKLIHNNDALREKIILNGRAWVVENRESNIAGPKLKEIYKQTVKKFIQNK